MSHVLWDTDAWLHLLERYRLLVGHDGQRFYRGGGRVTSP